MKITKLHLVHFGHFHDFVLSLSDGFNILYGENEWGKTTVMHFIRMMLYAEHNKKLRQQIMPWDGSTPQGEMELLYQDKHYRVRKIFGAGPKSDKVSVECIDTGETVRLSPNEDVGTYFLQLDETGFSRCVIAFDGGMMETGNSEYLNRRLSNLLSTGEESVSEKAAKEHLEKAMNALLKPKAKTGRLSVLQEKRRQTEESANKLLETEEEREAQEAKRRLLKAQYEEAKANLEALTRQKKAHDAIRDIERLARYEKTCNAIESVQESLSSPNVPPEELDAFIREAKTKLAAYDHLQAKPRTPRPNGNRLPDNAESTYHRLQEAYTIAKNDWELMDKKILPLTDEINRYQKPSKSAGFWVTAVSALLGVLVFMWLAFMLSYWFLLGGLIVLVVATSVYLAGLSEQKDREKAYQTAVAARKNALAELSFLVQENDSIEDLQKKVQETEAAARREWLSFLEDTGCRTPADFIKAIRTDEEIREWEKTTKAAEEERTAVLQELLSFVSRFAPVSTAEQAHEQISWLSEQKSDLTSLLVMKSTMQKDTPYSTMSAAERQEEKKRLTALLQGADGAPFSEAQWEETQLEVHSLANRLTELVYIEPPAENAKTLLRQAEMYKEQEAQLEAYYTSLKIAYDTLLEAEIEMQAEYKPNIDLLTGDYLSVLTDGKYKEAQTDKSGSVMIHQPPHLRDASLFSKGTTAQIYLAARLAYAKFLSRDKAEPMPFLLDDVLADYDDTRLKHAIELMIQETENQTFSQVILFTCHRGYEQYAALDSMKGW